MDSHLQTLCIPIIFLKNELKLLEKSRKHLLSKLKVENPELATQLLKEFYILDTIRNDEDTKTETKFAEIDCILRQIRMDFNKVDEPNFPIFHRTVLKLEGKISTLRKEKEQRLRKLQSDLIETEINLQYKFNRAALYENMRYHYQPVKLKNKNNLKTQELQEKDFDGWQEDDHNLFKKLFKLYGPATTIKVTTILLPDLTEQDVLQHAEWYHQLKHHHKYNNDKIKKLPVSSKSVQKLKRSKSCLSPSRHILKLKEHNKLCGCKSRYKKSESESSELLKLTLSVDDMIRQFRKDNIELK